MAAEDDVSYALQQAVIGIVNAAPNGAYVNRGKGPKFVQNVPCQVIIGFPFGTSLTEILGNAQAQISVFPLTEASRTVTDRKPMWKVTQQNYPTINAAVKFEGDSFTITFYGQPAAGFNIHTLIGGAVGQLDAPYQTTSEDTLETIAAAVGDAISALGLSGVTVVAAGESVTASWLSGAYLFSRVQVNIGGTATMAQEVARVMTPFQISVWAANADLRDSYSKQIDGALCMGVQNNFLYAADGSAIRVRRRGEPRPNDQSQRSYSLYVSHLIYECTYPKLQTTEGTQVEVVAVNGQLDDAIQPVKTIGITGGQL